MKTWIWLVWKAIIHNPAPIMCEKASLTPFSLSSHMEDIVQTKFHERLNLELKGHEVSNHMVMIQLHQFCWILITTLAISSSQDLWLKKLLDSLPDPAPDDLDFPQLQE